MIWEAIRNLEPWSDMAQFMHEKDPLTQHEGGVEVGKAEEAGRPPLDGC